MYKLTDTFVLILLIFVFFICRLYNIKEIVFIYFVLLNAAGVYFDRFRHNYSLTHRRT